MTPAFLSRAETDLEQSERFRKAVRELEAAGELSPTGEAALERVLNRARSIRGGDKVS